MKQSGKRDRRSSRGAGTDAKSIRTAFIINMFREFPDRIFSLKQLTSASGGNSKEARYIVRDVVEALVAEGVVDCHGRDKYQLSTSQLPHYEGVVDMIGSGAAYVKVDALESDIYVHQRNVNYALEGDVVEVVLQRQAVREGDHAEGAITRIIERSNKQYVGVAEVAPMRANCLRMSSSRVRRIRRLRMVTRSSSVLRSGARACVRPKARLSTCWVSRAITMPRCMQSLPSTICHIALSRR